MSYDNSHSTRCYILRYRCWRARGYSREPGVRSRRHSRRSHRTARVVAVPRPRRTVFLSRRPSDSLPAAVCPRAARVSPPIAFGVSYFDHTTVSSPDATTEVPTTKPHKDDGPAAQQTPTGTPQIADVGGGGDSGPGPVRSETAEKPSRHPLTAVCFKQILFLRLTREPRTFGQAHNAVGTSFTRNLIFSFVFLTRLTFPNPNLPSSLLGSSETWHRERVWFVTRISTVLDCVDQ